MTTKLQELSIQQLLKLATKPFQKELISNFLKMQPRLQQRKYFIQSPDTYVYLFKSCGLNPLFCISIQEKQFPTLFPRLILPDLKEIAPKMNLIDANSQTSLSLGDFQQNFIEFLSKIDFRSQLTLIENHSNHQVYSNFQEILKACTSYKPILRDIIDSSYTLQLRKSERNFMDLVQVTLDDAGEPFYLQICGQIDRLFPQKEKEIRVQTAKIAAYLKFIWEEFGVPVEKVVKEKVENLIE